MNTIQTDTKFFYDHFFDKNRNTEIEKKMVELAVMYPHLSRFTAALNINILDVHQLSQDTVNKFNSTRMAIIATNLKQQAFISSLSKILEQQNLQIILLKSSALNGYLYPNQRCRGNSDIDILINPKDEAKIHSILEHLAKLHHTVNSQPFDGLYERTWISKKDHSLFIDVHTALTNPKLFNIQFTDIQNQSKQHPYYNSSSIRIMSPEHNLIHAGLHIIGDGYLPHHSFLDAALIVSNEKTNIDIRLLFATSSRWGCKTSTQLLLDELGRLFKFHTFNYSKDNAFRIKLGRILLNKHFAAKTLKRRIQQVLIQLTLIDGLARVTTTQLSFIKRKTANLFRF
jgi:hypothetical protein